MNESVLKKLSFGPSPAKERRDSRKLWNEMFPEDSLSFLQYYESVRERENAIVIRYDGKLPTAMAHWNPVTVNIRGKQYPSAYIIAVATKPEYRHRGLMAGLLKEGLNDLAAAGMPFVFLMPADPAIYLPFGFRYVWDRTVASCENLRAFAEGYAEESICAESAKSDSLHIRLVEPEEYPAAAAWINRELSARFDVFQERTEKYLRDAARECASEGGAICGIYRGEEMAGIFDWWEEDGVSLRELIVLPEYEEKEHSLPAKEILSLICSYFGERESLHAVIAVGSNSPVCGSGSACGDSSVCDDSSVCSDADTGSVECCVTADKGTAENSNNSAASISKDGSVTEPGGRFEVSQEPIIMARITSLTDFLSMVTADEETEILLDVTDPLIPANQGRFRWNVGPSGSSLERISAGGAEEADKTESTGSAEDADKTENTGFAESVDQAEQADKTESKGQAESAGRMEDADKTEEADASVCAVTVEELAEWILQGNGHVQQGRFGLPESLRPLRGIFLPEIV